MKLYLLVHWCQANKGQIFQILLIHDYGFCVIFQQCVSYSLCLINKHSFGNNFECITHFTCRQKIGVYKFKFEKFTGGHIFLEKTEQHFLLSCQTILFEMTRVNSFDMVVLINIIPYLFVRYCIGAFRAVVQDFVWRMLCFF